MVDTPSCKQKRRRCLGVSGLSGDSRRPCAFYFLAPLGVAILLSSCLGAPPIVRVGGTPENPHPDLVRQAQLSRNRDRKVPRHLQSDPDNILDVQRAYWKGDRTPLTLAWDVKAGSPNEPQKVIACDNCVYLSPHVRRFVAKAIRQPWASNLTAIGGFDPVPTAPGEYPGTGWGVRFYVPVNGANNPTEGIAGGLSTAGDMLEWILGCNEAGKGTKCNNAQLGVMELIWSNQVWSAPTCADHLRNYGPDVYNLDYSDELASAQDDAQRASINDLASFSSVQVALPIYRPIYKTTKNVSTVSRYVKTGCEKAGE